MNLAFIMAKRRYIGKPLARGETNGAPTIYRREQKRHSYYVDDSDMLRSLTVQQKRFFLVGFADSANQFGQAS